jgi:Secretion system C-terminal sorting domain
MKTFGIRALALSATLLISGWVVAQNTALTSGAWENGTNWSSGVAPVATDNVVVPAGFAMTVNAAGDLCASLTIAGTGSVTINNGDGLAIGGSLSNAGTFTAVAGSTLTFNGAANSTITGGGTYTIAGTVVMNLNAATTTLDVQDANFITGINAGGNYYFTFKKGTWIMDNAGTLNDSYNSGSTNALTIPFGVVIQSNNGIMNLAKNGTMATIGNGTSSYGQSNIILSGELYINGGTVDVAFGQTASSNSGQTVNMGVDLQYHANGGSPELLITSGTLNLGSGFDYYTTTDYIDFNMSGGTIVAAVKGSSYMGTFQLNDYPGGQTVMSGGLIELTDASWGVYPDIDLGGTNVQSVLYSVTGGTVQFGSPATANSGTYFAFEAWSTTNYPNFSFEPGMAKVAQPLNNSDFRIYSLTANANMTFSVADYLTGNTTKNMTIDGNNGSWAFDDEGGFVVGTSTVHFIGSANQMINSSALTTVSFYNLVIGTLSGASASVSGNLNTIKVGGNLTMSSGTFSPGTMTTLDVTGTTTLTAGTLTAPATINESGNWTNNGGTFVPNSGTLNFNGTAAQVINGTTAAQNFYNLTTKMSVGQTLSTGGSTATVVVASNLTETSGNITAPATLTVLGNVLLTAGTFNAGTNTNIGGNFTNNSNAFVANSNTVTFNGSTAQTIGGSFGTTFYNMTAANSGGHVILGILTTVSNQFAFTLGMLDASKKPLTITSGLAITGASGNSYIIVGNGVSTMGYLTIDNLPASTATLYPIGTATYYLPATLNPGTNTGDAFSAYVFTPAAYSGVYGGAAFTGTEATNILNTIWNISQTAGSGSATLGVNWTSAGTTLDGSAFVSDGTNIGILQHNSGGYWNAATGSGNVATFSATSSFGSFGQFVVGTLNYVLALTVTDFNATLNSNNTVSLAWTASRIGLSSFDVQRSTDGIDWTTIGEVAASAADADGQYSFIDPNPAPGINYYRIFSQQTDGGSSYSDIRTVNLAGMAAIGIYPNPTTDLINVSVSNATPDLCIRLVSLTGQVLQTVKPGATGASVTTINVQRYPAAIYFVQLVNSQRVLQVSSVMVTR